MKMLAHTDNHSNSLLIGRVIRACSLTPGIESAPYVTLPTLIDSISNDMLCGVSAAVAAVVVAAVSSLLLSVNSTRLYALLIFVTTASMNRMFAK